MSLPLEPQGRIILHEPRLWVVQRDAKLLRARHLIDTGDGVLQVGYTWVHRLHMQVNPVRADYKDVARMGETKARQWAEESQGEPRLATDVEWLMKAEQTYLRGVAEGRYK